MTDTDDLFDDQPATFVPRRDRPKPWQKEHPEHPSQRPENQLEDGETAPTSWNVATTDLGILHMRKFLAWCEEKEIDTAGHTVGSLYCGLNAHSLASFRWLCQQLARQRITRLPSIVAMSKAILKRDPALLYSDQ